MIVFQIPAQMFYQLHQSKIFNRTTSVTETQKHQCTMGFAMHIQEKKKNATNNLSCGWSKYQVWQNNCFTAGPTFPQLCPLAIAVPLLLMAPHPVTVPEKTRQECWETRRIFLSRQIIIIYFLFHLNLFLFEYVCSAISDIVLSYGFQFSSCISFILSYECTNLNNQWATRSTHALSYKTPNPAWVSSNQSKGALHAKP